MKSILMIGQSNMAGRGDFEEVSPIDNPRTYMLRNGRWQPMSEPVNPDRSVVYPLSGEERVHSGISLAARFADCFAHYFDEDIGLIPCAEGGSKISEWAEGELLFDHALMQTKLAMRTSDLAGIIWHQGESDSKCSEDVEAYFDRLTGVIAALRRRLGREDLPVVMGELGDVSAYKNGVMRYWQEINREIHRASAAIGNCGVASSAGLKLRHDKLHFNSTALRTLGERYFDIYRNLQHGIGGKDL